MTRVGEVLRLQRRAVEVEPLTTYTEIGVRSFGKGIFHKEPVTGVDLGSKRVFRVEPGDLILSNVFAWEGAVAVASEEERGCIGSHRFMTYIAFNGRADASYLRSFFLSEPGLRLLRDASPGSAGRNRTLAIERFEALEIPLPAPSEQRRIADHVEVLLGLQRAAALAIQSSSPETILGFLPILVQHELEQASTGTMSIGELAEVVSDVVHPGEDPAPARTFVGLQHIEPHTGRRLGEDPVGSEKGRKFRFRPGDIAYGYLRPYLNKIWLADRPGLCSVDQYVLRPRPAVRAGLLAHILRSRSALDQANALTHNLQLPRLRSGLLASMHVPLIPHPAQEALETRLDSLVARFVELARLRRRQSEWVAILSTTILDRAFAGLI